MSCLLSLIQQSFGSVIITVFLESAMFSLVEHRTHYFLYSISKAFLSFDFNKGSNFDWAKQPFPQS